VPKGKDRLAVAQQNKLLLGFFAEQWYILLFGFPFMFLGSITDFFFPNFIGKAINAMKTGTQEEVINNILTWVVFMCIGAVSSLIRDTLFGITSERIGLSIRGKLFEAIIRKDVSFYDDNRTGDIRKLSITNLSF